METGLSAFSTVLTSALNAVNRARNQVGTLHLHTSFRDPDIFERVTLACDQLARAEGMLEALRSDIDVWLKEETSTK